jgi:8-oxo-dGTP pyrophosphatase MutT (NUDIX family)
LDPCPERKGADLPQSWQGIYIPGGKRELGENDLDTLSREVKEELAVGIMIDRLHRAGTLS